jgi:hypothetical protein
VAQAADGGRRMIRFVNDRREWLAAIAVTLGFVASWALR